MATQNCPKCSSSRIRQGYRPTSVLMKLVFRYNLLCDECNWEFSGFAVPGTVGTKTKKRKNFKISGSLPNSIDQDVNLESLENNFSNILDEEILSATELIEETVFEEIPQSVMVEIPHKKKAKSKFKKKVRVKLH